MDRPTGGWIMTRTSLAMKLKHPENANLHPQICDSKALNGNMPVPTKSLGMTGSADMDMSSKARILLVCQIVCEHARQMN